jgi:hypothetical protein
MFILTGAGIVGVFVAMNVLVTAAPAAVVASPSTSPTPVFADTPSALPLDSPSQLETPAPSASLPSTRPVIINSVVSGGSKGIWSYYLAYPAFLAGTTPWAQQIDDDVFAEVQARALQWAQGPAADRQVPGKVNTLTGGYTTELLTPELASFTLTWVDDSSAEYPAMGVSTLNFDLSTGQRIALDSVFTDLTTALTIISGRVLTPLEEQLGADYDSWLAVDGTSPTADHYVHWAVTKVGVKITFDQYQVTARRGPLLSVVVPWDPLRQVMVPTGPVAKLAGF